MERTESLKKQVQQKYSQMARDGQHNGCGEPSSCSPTDRGSLYTIMSDDYTTLQGYNPDADLGLGCGLPTQFTRISAGDTVVDLGSGEGNDCFVARHETNPTGKVIGIDFSEDMIAKARRNTDKLGFDNVEFVYGDLEAIPLDEQTADVVVSNCVLNLVPNKPLVMSEIYRILKPGGHFSISDIVLTGELPTALQQEAEMYAGCVAGAIQKEIYLHQIQEAGFTQITLQKEKPINLPDEILAKYLSPAEIESHRERSSPIVSVTVYAVKPCVSSSQDA
uniref:Arsenite methyltransferase n=1 Tax=Roseihalotalea indica TaxID=2867963 RepID=A0AA49GIH3_9BACT|nr:arsenite methyltransferase [Tunicatimonas sp. TK19036]